MRARTRGLQNACKFLRDGARLMEVGQPPGILPCCLFWLNIILRILYGHCKALCIVGLSIFERHQCRTDGLKSVLGRVMSLSGHLPYSTFPKGADRNAVSPYTTNQVIATEGSQKRLTCYQYLKNLREAQQSLEVPLNKCPMPEITSRDGSSIDQKLFNLLVTLCFLLISQAILFLLNCIPYKLPLSHPRLFAPVARLHFRVFLFVTIA
jgi:hypothetical protein